MPKLSDTMTEGVVAQWHKKVGDVVESGELLAEIETDKATMEFESFLDGVLLHIGVDKGGAAPVNSVLCVIGEKGEDFKALLAEAASSSVEAASKAAPVAEKKASPASPPSTTPAKPAPTKIAAEVVGTDSANERTKASPMARRLASEKGISIGNITGSGDNGRIVKRDVEAYNPMTGGRSAIFQEKYTEEPVSQMRKTIARRLSQSKFEAPHFYLTMEIDMDNAIEARKAIIARDEVKVSFNDMVIKAAAAALRRHPKVNSSWLEDRIRYNEHVHIGVAVAVEDGLLVPVVRFADSKTLPQINVEVKEYAQRAKAKKLQPEDWEGNTFTISNLGMFGIEEFTAIVNPPDACIMAIGGIKQTPVVKNGAVVPGNVMKVTLSCDHRVVDGVSGSEFLLDFKANMENPVLMFM